MGEKRIDELNDAQYPSYYHYLPIDRDVAAETAKLKADYFGRANDSSDIRCLGNTNNTGAIIPSGKYFYKYDTYHSNRALAKAISNIAVNATLTENTNFKYVTIGEELDSLNAALTGIKIHRAIYPASTTTSSGNISTDLSADDIEIISAYGLNVSEHFIVDTYVDVTTSKWVFHASTYNGSIAASKQMNVRYFYVPRSGIIIDN